MMYKFFWLVTLVIAFLMGYVAHQEQPFSFEESSEQKNCVAQSSSAASVDETSSNASSTASDAQTSQQATSTTQQIVEKNATAEISNQAIDKLLAKPYANILKGSHGDTRKLYKKFAEETSVSEWGAQMNGKLKDAILTSNNASHIHLESVTCRVDFCEVLLLEAKEGVWSTLLSEMVLQNWWGFGQVSTLGQNLTDNPKYSMAYIVLLSKK